MLVCVDNRSRGERGLPGLRRVRRQRAGRGPGGGVAALRRPAGRPSSRVPPWRRARPACSSCRARWRTSSAAVARHASRAATTRSTSGEVMALAVLARAGPLVYQRQRLPPADREPEPERDQPRAHGVPRAVQHGLVLPGPQRRGGPRRTSAASTGATRPSPTARCRRRPTASATRCAGWASTSRTACSSSCPTARSSPSPGSGRPRSGAVIAMVNPLLPAEDFVHYFEYSAGARWRWWTSRRSTASTALRDSFPPPAPPGGGGRAAAATSPSRRLCAGASDRLANADTHRDDPAIWLFTSGSTGKPKAAVHLQQDLPWNTERYAKQVMGIREDDLTVSVPKLFFGYATGTNLLFPFAVGGATALFSERSEPGHAVRRHRALPADHPHLRAHHDQRHAEPSRGRRARPLLAAAVPLRGRGPAARAVPALEGDLRGGDPGRHRLGGDVPHLHLELPRRGGAGQPGPAGAGLRGAHRGRRRRGTSRPARRARCGSRASRRPSSTGRPTRSRRRSCAGTGW